MREFKRTMDKINLRKQVEENLRFLLKDKAFALDTKNQKNTTVKQKGSIILDIYYRNEGIRIYVKLNRIEYLIARYLVDSGLAMEESFQHKDKKATPYSSANQYGIYVECERIEINFRYLLDKFYNKETACNDKIQVIAELIDNKNLKGKEREYLVKTRINQDYFRTILLKKNDGCCLCKVKKAELLIASHIKPWSKSEPEQKLDPENGLLLCPDHDALFDKGYITFDDNGQIIISASLSDNDKDAMRLYNIPKICLSEKKREYMEYHRKHIFK